MKYLLLSLTLCLALIQAAANDQPADQYICLLDQAIADREKYMEIKKTRIDSLRRQFAIHDDTAKYHVCNKLVVEYMNYSPDAIACNARSRMLEMSKTIPIIDANYNRKQAETNLMLYAACACIGVLSVLLLVITILLVSAKNIETSATGHTNSITVRPASIFPIPGKIEPVIANGQQQEWLSRYAHRQLTVSVSRHT